MHHVIFESNTSYKAAILIKPSSLKKAEMEKAYVEPLCNKGMKPDELIGFSLTYDANNKAPIKVIRSYLATLLPVLDSLGVTTLFVCDGAYFKPLTKSKTAEPHYGYVLPCAIKGFEHMSVCLSANYQGVHFNPAVQDKIDLSIEAMATHAAGSYKELGADIVKYEYYPSTVSAISDFIRSWHAYPQLALDIEAFSLKFYEAGIGTVGAAWDEHHGGAFAVDYDVVRKEEEGVDYPAGTLFGSQGNNTAVKLLLREFLETYEGRIIWHNAGYDAKVMIYELWMDHPLDQIGMLKGIEVMTRRFDDTQIIVYLSHNSTAGNKLGLKANAHEFAGNYAEDVKDICYVPLPRLLRYNLVDCLCTWYVYKRDYQTMVDDQQLWIYQNIFIPSVKVILQMELTGLPTIPSVTAQSRVELTAIQDKHTANLFAEKLIQDFEKTLKMKRMLLDNEKLIKHVRTLDELDHIKFNPNSVPNLQDLLYLHLGYDVIDKTDTKQPATGAKTIKKLRAQAKDPAHIRIFDALIGLGEVGIILNNFISAFETKGLMKADGRYYVHGSFKLGGTVSGRLSSSDPNLMNMPAGADYAKYTKRCFVAPDGWLLMGADFASLEDRISALTTKDPNKLKVYTDGYDGHCLRAYGYYGHLMPDISNNVADINSIAKKYPALRQKSKTPTFLLTYQGTFHGLMAQLGMERTEAIMVEERYHTMYAHSDNWVAERIEGACKNGYVTVAFGLRVRTPVLARSILKNGKTPYEAQSESRTAGNALGQSWGMLNNRAGIEFQERCLSSKYLYDIKPIAHIHDAQYFLVRDDIDCIEWFNTNLVECMEWQDHPEIEHPDVKLGGEVDVFHPSWANSITLSNGMSADEIQNHCRTEIETYYAENP